MNRAKLVLLAATTIALVFTFTACGGSKPASVAGFQEITTPADEFTRMCRTELKDYLCGVGENTSTNTQIARNVATANARSELASKITVSVDEALKRSYTNTFNEEGRETVFGRLKQDIAGTFSNIDIYETKTWHDKETNKYRIFVLVAAKKDEVKNVAKDKVSNTQVLQDAAASKIFMDMIDEELNKGR